MEKCIENITQLKVILSDASVPGEGEHKIMDFIRRQRNQATHNINTRHVIYGLDADLIMLALATHEPHFWILREDVFFKDGKQRGCFICGQTGHMAAACTGKKKEIIGEFDDQSIQLAQKPFVFLNVAILREYLDIDLRILDLDFWDLERALDDWIFLIFFVGNDFLPHLPSLEIREGAIDTLIEIWKKKLRIWGSFITDSGDISLLLVRELMAELGNVEDKVFIERRDADEGRRKARLRRKQEGKKKVDPRTEELKKRLESKQGFESYPVKDFRAFSKRQSEETNEEAAKRLRLILDKKAVPVSGAGKESNEDAAKRLRQLLEKKQVLKTDIVEKTVLVEVIEEIVVAGEDVTADSCTPLPVDDAEISEDVELIETSTELESADSDDEAPQDDVRLWESGWKIRYYESKFKVDVGDEAFRLKVVDAYIEGLCWVLQYYYQGCASWQWFYPYHYSPFASDFSLTEKSSVNFVIGTPFNPIEQLMAVLPAASRAHIPSAFHSLMTDEDSPIIDFYPVDFPIDLNGKKYEWQGVALLPFIDAQRLLDTMKTCYPNISPEEVNRNTLGTEILLFENSVPFYDDMCLLYGKTKVNNV